MVIKYSGGRFSDNFRELIEKIKVLEKERTNNKLSDTAATEIVYQRILKAGGWKEEF